MPQHTILNAQITINHLEEGHQVGTDAVLLGAAIQLKPTQTLADLGCGVGGVSLCAAFHNQGIITLGIEKVETLATLFEENLYQNNRIGSSVVCDIHAGKSHWQKAGLRSMSVECIAINPPYNDPSHQSSPDALKSLAYMAQPEDIKHWIDLAFYLGKPKSHLCMITRTQNLPQTLKAMENNFGSVQLLPIQTVAGKDAKLLIIHAIKKGKAPLRLHPPVVLRDEQNAPTKTAQLLYAGQLNFKSIFYKS